VLANEHVASAEVAELIAEAEGALEKAHADVRLHHERTLDITADPRKEQQAIADAELSAKRLVIALDRLKSHHNALLLAEISARWIARFEAVEKTRNTVAEKFKRYEALAYEMAEILAEAAAVDQEVRAINAERPDNETRYLYGVELTARGLRSFSQLEPSLAETTVLPGYWPPKRNPSAAIEMLLTSPAAPFGGDWWADRERIEQERAVERERMAKHYKQLGAEQTERQNREERIAVAQRVAR
jgi:hypothetical protein